ncbi:inositol monophosphatase family protein [Microbacterium allomyrinae]|uniref:Phosphatase n=1 Tax=Microbacterium allomyrinae TaxID=2830666 RepID=A0A9X1LT37_9MICO|nr:inositol monophosphatase family protein [Microbacterium allomyrinae]MCC2031322.1 phosphatase [Microbacterium allomyrinae]
MGPSDAEVAVLAAQAGGAVVRRDYAGVHARYAKRGIDFATQTDIDAERAILDVLRRERPDDAVRGEEVGLIEGSRSSRRWLVDPLCGTLNFAAGTPLVAVNVALTDQAEVMAAAVVDPLAERILWTDGTGSFERRAGQDRHLAPCAVSRLVDVNCDGPLDRKFIGGALVADARLRAAFGPRVISSTLAVAWVASGRRAGYVSDGAVGSFGDNVHYAAGIALCEAAGCVVTDLEGGPLRAGRGLVIAADAPTHDALLAIVRAHL